MTNINFLVTLTATLGDRMKEAGLNTIIGMAVVTSVLIVIAAIIYLFKFIPQPKVKRVARDKKTNNARQSKTSKSVAKSTDGSTAMQETNSTELVAVITAAIMASMSEEGIEVPEDGLVIRSIRRKNHI